MPTLYLGCMARFVYRCPTTGRNVQGFVADSAVSDDSVYEAITCALCKGVHLVNAKTGRVIAQNLNAFTVAGRARARAARRAVTQSAPR